MDAKMRARLIERRNRLEKELKDVKERLGNYQFEATYKGWQVEIWRYGKGFSYRRKRTGESDAEWRYCTDSWPTTKEAAAAAKAEVGHA